MATASAPTTGIQFDAASALLAAGIVAATAMTFMARDPDVHPAVLRDQALVSRTRNPGETGVYRNKLTPHGTKLRDSLNGFGTAYDAFWSAVKTHDKRPFIGHRVGDGPFIWNSYADLAGRVKNIGSGLIRLASLKGISPPRSTPVAANMLGVLLKNCPEWLIADYACISYGLVTVPIHENFDSDNIVYILNHTEMSTLLTGKNNIERVLDALPRSKFLKFIVIADVDEVPKDIVDRGKAHGATIVSFKDLEALGEKHLVEPHAPDSKDIVTISYTSGTTGNPKGAMLRHEALMAAGAGILDTLPKHLSLGNTDRHLSYLPMSHMLERALIHNVGILGCKVGFFRGDILQLFDDIAELKPTIFPTVPRLLNRLYDRIRSTIDASGFIGKTVFGIAYNAKKRLLEKGIISRTTIWDRLVFGKVQQRIGGEVRCFVTGAAPINPEILQFVRIVFGVNILEGYGQTETCASGTITMAGDYLSPFGSHIGVPFACSEYKLIDVPTMEYFVTDSNPRGEICLRGPTVMTGYYKDPVKTAEALDADGWLHTGDVGEVQPNGTLKIIDRIKAMIKLSQGEYIAPEKIELVVKSRYLAQVYVHGDSLQSCVVVVGMLDPDVILPWAARDGLEKLTLEELAKNERVHKLILDDIVALGRANKLPGYEIPKALFLDAEQMTIENGLLTPTFKTKRHEARKKYAAEIERMYKSVA
ncbi:hypothetical protein BC831DRAFT_476855 [Entophlyctis helioformis]|nr:hypothetical protein BC831DRAFT_476855 [Entophlyctis helioformis]